MIFSPVRKEDIVLAILKYGVSKGQVGTTYDEIYQVAVKNGYLNEEEFELIKEGNKQTWTEEFKLKKIVLDNLFESIFPDNITFGRDIQPAQRVFSLESYFRFIEHQELVEARENAKGARNYSMIAIALAAITLIISVIIPFIIAEQQSSTPLKIEDIISIESEQLKSLNEKTDSLLQLLKTDTIQTQLIDENLHFQEIQIKLDLLLNELRNSNAKKTSSNKR